MAVICQGVAGEDADAANADDAGAMDAEDAAKGGDATGAMDAIEDAAMMLLLCILPFPASTAGTFHFLTIVPCCIHERCDPSCDSGNTYPRDEADHVQHR